MILGYTLKPTAGGGVGVGSGVSGGTCPGLSPETLGRFGSVLPTLLHFNIQQLLGYAVCALG